MDNIEQLKQCVTATWDGDLINKTSRDALVKAGLICRFEGYNLVTKQGLKTLINLNLLKHG